jgi:hypothetical protein
VKNEEPPKRRQAGGNSTPLKPGGTGKSAEAEPRSSTPRHVTALLASDWCSDSVVFQKLTDLFGSWQRAREEINLAVSTGKVGSIRYPSLADGDRWDKRIMNTEEFWRGRKYFRIAPGILETGVDEGDGTYVVDSEWTICFSVEDSCRHWPGLLLQPLFDGRVTKAREAKAGTGGISMYDWEYALTLFGILIYEGKIDPEKATVRKATELLITEWAKKSEKTPELYSSEARKKVGKWLRVYQETTD